MNRSPSAADASAVILVGHGTKDLVGTAQFFELGERLAERLKPQMVEASLLEFQRPTIPEAWSRLVERGAEHIHVAPLLLFAAGHAKQDIPEIVAECQATTPGIAYDQSRPISRHRSIVDLVTARIHSTLLADSSDGERIALVMVGRGNRDPCAQADMRLLSEVVSRRIDVADVFTAFYAMAEPALPAVLLAVATSGNYDRVIVHPHLLFTGRLFEAISRQVEEASEQCPRVRFQLSGYLGPDRLVADAIADRIAQVSTE